MLVGSLVAEGRWPVWIIPDFRGGSTTWLLIGFVVIFGTLLSFSLYLMSLTYISPSTASVLTSAEPLVATLASVLWLHVHLALPQYVGATLIILGVVLLALKPEGTHRDVPHSLTSSL
jgi:drug/metabolite transporter (DMT)-like permease